MEASFARELVAELIARELRHRVSTAPEASAEASVLGRVAEQLTRWVGAEGCRALLGRALVRAQSSHPALAGVSFRSHSQPVLEGLPEAIELYGAAPIAAGLQSVLVSLFELLARLLGDDLTTKLAERDRSDAPAGRTADKETQSNE